MGKTVKEFLAEKMSSGADPLQAYSDFQKSFGFPLSQVDMDSPIASPVRRVLPNMKPIPEFPTEEMGKVAAQHQGPVEKFAKNVGVKLPATLAGAAKSFMSLHPAMHIAEPEEYRKQTAKIGEAYKQASKQIESRYKEEGPLGAYLNAMGEWVTGPAHLLESAFTSPVGTVQQELEKGYATGKELPAQIAGSAAASITHPKQDLPNAVLWAAPGLGAAKSGAKAAAIAASRTGGTVGKVGGAVARGIEAAESIKPLQGTAEWAAQKAGVPEAIEQATSKIKDMVDIGALHPEKAAELIKNLTPFQAVAMQYGADASALNTLGSIGKAAKRAVLGEILTGGTLPPGVGAVAGAALSGGADLIKMFAPAAHAAFKRNVQNPYAQEYAGQEQAVRGVVSPGVNTKSELRAKGQQLAAETRKGVELKELPSVKEIPEAQIENPPLLTSGRDIISPMSGSQELATRRGLAEIPAAKPEAIEPVVEGTAVKPTQQPAPSGPRTARTPTYFSPVKEVSATGELGSATAARAEELSSKARELEQMSEYLKQIRSVVRNVQDEKNFNWQELNQRIANGIAGLDYLAEGSVAKKNLVESIKDAIKSQKSINIKDALYNAQNAIEEQLDALRGGRVFERDLSAEMGRDAQITRAELNLKNAVRNRDSKIPGLTPEQAQAAVDRAQTELNAAKAIPFEKAPPPIPGVTNIHRGVEMASGGARITPAGVQVTETTSPAFNSLLDEVHAAVNKNRLPNDQIPRDWSDRILTNVFSEQGQGGLGALHSERVRGLVVDGLVKEMGLSGKAAKTFGKQLNEYINEMLGKFYEGEPEGLVIQLPNGKRVNLAERTREALAGDPKFRSELLADAQQSIAETIADQAHAKQTAESFVRELTQDIPEVALGKGKQRASTAQTVQDYAARLADRLSRGGSVPIMVPFNPQEIAAQLRSIAETNPTATNLADTIKALEKFKAASGDVQSFIGKQGVSHPGTGVWLSPGAQASLSPYLKMINNTGEIRGLMDWLSSRLRGGATKYNIGGAKNNIVSNAFLDSYARGLSPLESAAQTVKATSQFRDFLDNKATGIEKLKWQAAVNNNMPALSMLGEYLGQARGALRMGSHKSMADMARSLGQAIDSGASTFYQMGDLGPKLSVYSEGFDRALGKVGSMEPGTYIVLDAPHGDSIRIEALGNGQFRVKGKNVSLNSQEMADAIGQHAVKNAADFFVDPTEAPLWAQKGRASNLFVSNMTAFPTWAWHMIDMPGKEGVLSRVAKSGTGVVRSNSVNVLTQNMMDLFELAARRAGITQLAKVGNTGSSPLLEKAVGAHGNLTMRVEPGEQEDVADISNYSKYNPFKLTQNMIQLGRLMGTYIESEAAKGSVKDQSTADRWANRFGGQEVGIRDIPEMLGLGGNMANQMLFDLRNGTKDPKDVLRDFGFALMGVTPGAAVKMAYDRASDKFIDNKSLQDVGEREIGSYMLSELFNIGARPYLMISDKGLLERRLKSVEANLNRGIIKPIQDEVDSANREFAAGRKVDLNKLKDLQTELADREQWVAEALGRKRQQYMEEWMKLQDAKRAKQETK